VTSLCIPRTRDSLPYHPENIHQCPALKLNKTSDELPPSVCLPREGRHSYAMRPEDALPESLLFFLMEVPAGPESPLNSSPKQRNTSGGRRNQIRALRVTSRRPSSFLCGCQVWLPGRGRCRGGWGRGLARCRAYIPASNTSIRRPATLRLLR
jgi:hypothetical protein